MPGITLFDEGAHELGGGQLVHRIRAEASADDGQVHIGFGRDTDPATAQAKAISETIERMAWRTLPPTQLLPAAALDSHIAPEQLVQYLPWQYDEDGFGPRPFHAGTPRHWLAAYSVLDGSTTCVPADCVVSPAAFDATYRQTLITHATSSGCASGTETSVCIERAVLELVERDAFMRHWFAQQPGIAVSSASLPDTVRTRIDWLAGQSAAVGARCLDMGLHPVWMVWVQHGNAHFTSLGMATGFDATTALENALAEAETLAIARLGGVPPVAIEPWQVCSPADHADLYATERHFRAADAWLHAEAHTQTFDTLRLAFTSHADALYQRMRDAGHPAYWTPLAPPGGAPWIGEEIVHTVRAIVPRLIPIGFGFHNLPLGMDIWGRAHPDAIHPFA